MSKSNQTKHIHLFMRGQTNNQSLIDLLIWPKSSKRAIHSWIIQSALYSEQEDQFTRVVSCLASKRTASGERA